MIKTVTTDTHIGPAPTAAQQSSFLGTPFLFFCGDDTTVEKARNIMRKAHEAMHFHKSDKVHKPIPVLQIMQ
jgi:hypothetical protein